LGSCSVFPRVHLFGNNVGCLTDSTGKQLSIFKNRRANLGEVVEREDFTRSLLNTIPKFSLRRQQIARAAYGLDGQFRIT
jgi:hypothetical protein